MALSTYSVNKLIDWYCRNQAYTLPTKFYVSLHSTVSSAAAAGTEITGNAYARAEITRSLANFSGTQGAGTTSVSSGTTGVSTNNIQVDFPTPTAAWPNVLSVCIFDAPTGGNMTDYFNLGTPKVIANAGDPVYIPINFFSTTITST